MLILRLRYLFNVSIGEFEPSDDKKPNLHTVEYQKGTILSDQNLHIGIEEEPDRFNFDLSKALTEFSDKIQLAICFGLLPLVISTEQQKGTWTTRLYFGGFKAPIAHLRGHKVPIQPPAEQSRDQTHL